MVAPDSQSDLKRLRTEVEQLRAEGLRQQDGWDAERRETKRLHAAVVRFKNRVAELEESAAALQQDLEGQTERADKAEQFVGILKARIDELRGSLERFGEHQRGCPRRQKLLGRRDAECTCGYDSMLAGGGTLEDGAGDEER